MKQFWRRFVDLPHHLSPREKIISIVLLLFLLLLGGWKIKNFIYNRLILMPTYGGSFTEGLVGQPQLLSPISSLDNNERTILSLIYVGLTKTTADGRTLPVLAEAWVISDDHKSYTFTLKPNLKWHDGQHLTTSDIAATISLISDPQSRSPYRSDWEGVTVEIVDDKMISFHLENPSAPFLAATDLPIIPMHLAGTDLQQDLIGNGPFRFDGSKSKDNQLTEVRLKSFDQWPDGKPYLDQIIWRFYDTEDSLIQAYRAGEVDSFVEWSTTTPDLPGITLQLPSQRHRLLFFNTARDNVKEQSLRTKLLNGTKLDNLLALKVITHQNLASHQAFTELLQSWRNQGATVELQTLDSLTLLDQIDKHDYDVLFADIDLRADLDIYPLWHSSQRGAGGYNFAQLDDSEIDHKLEQERSITDLNERRQLTDEVNNRLHSLAVYQDLEQVNVIWHVSNRIQGIPKLKYVVDASDHFEDITHWYIKTKHRTWQSIQN